MKNIRYYALTIGLSFLPFIGIFLFFVLVGAIFFYKTFLFFQIPFPGDNLVGNYAPYNSYTFLGFSPGGFPNKAQDFDTLRLIYPAKSFSIEIFKTGQFPLWNPYIFSGNPHLASLQSGSFYPLNILFFIFPFIIAWTIYIFIQPVLAGIFTYLLLKEFRLSTKSCLFGGIVFSFSSYSTVWMEYGNLGHTIIWLPFAMWLALKNIQKPTYLKSVILILSLTASILAGYIQNAFYLFVFLFAFVLFNIFLNNKEKANKLLLFIPIFITPFLLSALQLIPLFELIKESSRSSYSMSSIISILIPQYHLATVFVPDFFGNPVTRNYWISGTYIERVSYIGVIPLFFALYAFIQKRNSKIWFFAVSLFITYLLTFNTYVARLFYSLNLPFISTGVPSRAMYIFCFSASILAAFGFNNFENLKKGNRRLLITTFIIGVVYAFLWIFVIIAPVFFKNSNWISNIGISKRNLILPSLILIITFGGIFVSQTFYKIKKIALLALIAFTVFDLFYFFQKITPFVSKDTIYPSTEVFNYLKSIQGINRSWGYGAGHIEANIQTYEKVFTADGYDALHIKRYGEFVASSKNGEIPASIPRSEAEIAHGYGSSDLRENFYRQRSLDLLGVKYILNKIDPRITDVKADYQTFNESIYRLIWQKAPWQIYENKNAAPRAFLAGDYLAEANKDKIIEKIYDKNFEVKEKIILEENLPDYLKIRKDDKSKAEITAYSPNKIVVRTNAKADMLLFLSDNYYPGWKVNIDGRIGKIYRADYSFRAVPVQKGKHEVTFNYYPESFDLGLKISVGSFMSLILLVILFKLKSFYYVKK